MEVYLIKAAQLILAFAILVIIHEFGHFLFARIFGVKVEKFYIFFNPFTSLFKWKPKKHIGGLNKLKFYSEDAAQEELERKELEKTSNDYNRLLENIKEDEKKLKKLDKSLAKALKRNNNSKKINGLKSQIASTETSLSRFRAALLDAEEKLNKQCALKNDRDLADHEAQKKEGKLKRFWGHTEYGIGWLPLGGYCKIAGMIDESMDTMQMKQPAQPWEFRSKPAWQRLLIMVAGVLFNFLLAILIYAGIVFATGEKYVTFKDAHLGMAYSGEAKKIGFQDGDIPLYADGKELVSPVEGRMQIIQAKEVKVLRNGIDTITIKIPENFIFNLDKEAKSNTAQINFMTYRIPAKITQVVPGEGASKGGIKPGDMIIAIDSVKTPFLDIFLPTLDGHSSQTVNLTVVRGNEKATNDTIVLPVTLSENSKMGVGLEIDPSAFFAAQEKHYNIFQSVPRGIQIGTERLVSYAQSMKLVFTKEGAKSVGGFGSIGSIFPEKWNWIAFWNIAAFLSVALAFMNILPIPALDGGHVMFLFYEVITGRKPSEKFMEWAQMCGMIFLLLLLLYANGMDIVRLFK